MRVLLRLAGRFPASYLTAEYYPFVSLLLWRRTRDFARDGNRRSAVNIGWIKAKRTDFGKAATVPFVCTELCGKETFYAVPGNGNTCRQTSEAKDVHIIILHALSRGKIIVTDSRSHPFNPVGGDGGSYATATEQDPTSDKSRRHGAGQRKRKVWIVVVSVILQIAEVHNLVAFCIKQDIDLLFHFVSAVIGGYADFHCFTFGLGKGPPLSSLKLFALAHELSAGCTHWAKQESRRGYKSFCCVSSPINAHIEALPYAGHAKCRFAPRKQA
jgi:hypothetical protein